MTLSVKWKNIYYEMKLFQIIVEGLIDKKWFWSPEKPPMLSKQGLGTLL